MSYDNSKALYNANLKTVLNDIIASVNAQNNSALLNNPTLAIGTSSKAKVKNNAFDVIRDGVITHIASAETAFTATTDDIADGKEATFLMYLDASNVLTLLKGTSATANSVCPDTPAGGLKVGEVKIATSGAIFDATTTELDAGTVTDTYTNKTDVIGAMSTYEGKNWLNQESLKTVLDAIVSSMAHTGVAKLLNNPTLVIGTSSKAKIKHSTFDVIKDGVVTTIAGGEVAFTATTDDLEDGDGAVYLVYLDGSTVKILKGTATTGGTDAVCPATPTDKTKMGEVKLVTSGAIFDATTTELDAVTITDTYTDTTDTIADVEIGDEILDKGKSWLYQTNLKTVLTAILARLNGFNGDGKVLKNPTIAIGTSSAAKVKTSAFDVLVDGALTTIIAAETAFTATTHDVADGYKAIFLVYLDGTTITLLKGTSVLSDETAVCPDTPAGKIKLGEVQVEADGALFDATTTLLSATTVIDTYTTKTDIVESIE